MPVEGEATGPVRPGVRRFGRKSRLRRSREFQRVSREGRRASSRHFVLLVAPRGEETASHDDGRLGLTVSRRVGGAVVRNRVKRRTREWFRQSTLRREAALDWVVIARPSAGSLASAELRDELESLGRKALARVAR